jgi:cytochrome c2
MPGQRKYIIGGFLTFATLFVVIYFVMGFISRKNSPGYCGTVNDYAFISKDTSKSYKDGKVLFQNKCAACHILFKDFTGPDLIGFSKRGPWGDRKKILMYLADPDKFYKGNKSTYVEELYKKSPISHQVFFLTDKELNDFIYYIESEEKNKKAAIQ